MDQNDFGGSPSADTSLAGSASADPAPASSTEAAATTDASSAPSSGAPQGESKEDLLSAVLSALPESSATTDTDKISLAKEGSPASQTPETDQPEHADPEGEIDLDRDPTKEELSKYHSRTRKRIERLLSERNNLREEATVARNLREYLAKNDIAKDDFQLTLDLATAMRRGDFRTFLEGVAPYVQLAQEALGLALPQDLQQQVQQGFMTTDVAARMSQERYARQIAEANAARMAQMQQQEQQSAATRNLQQSVEQTVASWEAQMRQRDPDYGLKEDAMKNVLWAVVRERGAPQNPEQAVQIAQEAYGRVNQMFSRVAPRPQATKPVPSSVNRMAGARPEPRSLMDAAMIGLERARR